MPAILSHYSFALPFASHSSYPEAMLVGSQGPDPFFFFGQLPWKKRANQKGVDAFGRNLHHIDITDIYASLLDYAYSSSEKELLLSYIKGLFLHFALDRACHPFVFPRAGFSSDPILGKKFSAAHCLYETMVDSLISHQKGTYTTRPQKALSIDDKEILAISKMWSVCNKKTVDNPSIDDLSFFYSVKDYRSSLRMTNTPHLLSSWFIPLITGKESLPAQMNIPKSLPKKYKDVDFLNLKKKPFLDYLDGMKRNDSWMEDEEKAKEASARFLSLCDKWGSSESDKATLKALVDSHNHDGTPIGAKMLYMDPVWPEYLSKAKSKEDN